MLIGWYRSPTSTKVHKKLFSQILKEINPKYKPEFYPVGSRKDKYTGEPVYFRTVLVQEKGTGGSVGILCKFL